MTPALDNYLRAVNSKMITVSGLLHLAVTLGQEYQEVDLMPILNAAAVLSKQCDCALDSVSMKKAGVA